MPLMASSEVILVPSGASTGNVTISWNFSPQKIKLEERTFKVGSTPGAFQPRVIPANQLVTGSYTQALTPGDVYEVRAFDIDFFLGTKASEERIARGALGKVVVHALGLPSTLERMSTQRVGGTFFRFNITTGSAAEGPIPTHAIMEVGKDPPVADASGFFTMPSPIMTVKSFTPKVTHVLTTDSVIFDLLPSDQLKLTEARHALIRVSDATGRWQQIRREFQTLRRTLTITFTTVDPQSLGEGPGETEAHMHFKLEVWDSDGQSWGNGPVRVFEFENEHTTLAPFPVTSFVPAPVHVVPPRLVRGEEAGLAVNVKEYDDAPFFLDENATSLAFGKPRPIRITPGEANENNTILTTVRARQENHDPFDLETELIVDVNVTIAVAHVP